MWTTYGSVQSFNLDRLAIAYSLDLIRRGSVVTHFAHNYVLLAILTMFVAGCTVLEMLKTPEA